MKKSLIFICTIMICFLLVGCGSKDTKKEDNKKDNKDQTSQNISGNLSDIVKKLYEGIPENQMPSLADPVVLDKETFVNFAFVDNVKYKEAVVSEPVIGAIAHSVVLIRLEDAKDASKVVEDIKKNANPRKWVCVEAEHTYVLSKGDLVVLIMSNEHADKIKENFENLK